MSDSNTPPIPDHGLIDAYFRKAETLGEDVENTPIKDFNFPGNERFNTL
jgi:hypothetical protein